MSDTSATADVDVTITLGVALLSATPAPRGTRRRAQQIQTRAADAALFLERAAEIRQRQGRRDQQNTNALRAR